MNNLIINLLSTISIILSLVLIINILTLKSKNTAEHKTVLTLTFILGCIFLILEVVLLLLGDKEIIMFFILAPIIFFTTILTCIKQED